MTKIGSVLAVAITLGAGMAQAQTKGIGKLEMAATPNMDRNIKGLDLFLFTLTEPNRRQKCHVLSDDDQQIECSRHFGKKSKIYQRSELLAIIRPPFHDHSWLWSFVPLSIGGGIIWGAVALSSITVVGAIPVAMVGGVVVLVAGIAAALGQDDQPEMVLYLKPGEALPLALRK